MLARQTYGYKENLYRNTNKKTVPHKINPNGSKDVFVMTTAAVCESVK